MNSSKFDESGEPRKKKPVNMGCNPTSGLNLGPWSWDVTTVHFLTMKVFV